MAAVLHGRHHDLRHHPVAMGTLLGSQAGGSPGVGRRGGVARVAAPTSTLEGAGSCNPSLSAAERQPALGANEMQIKQGGGRGARLLRRKAQLVGAERSFQCEPPSPQAQAEPQREVLSPKKNMMSPHV